MRAINEIRQAAEDNGWTLTSDATYGHLVDWFTRDGIAVRVGYTRTERAVHNADRRRVGAQPMPGLGPRDSDKRVVVLGWLNRVVSNVGD